MKTLRRLGTAVVMTFVLGFSAFAGEVLTPPCAPPDPGEVLTPPCASAQRLNDDSVALGETSTPPASSAVDIYHVAEAAITLLLF
jgi:hypothetical protein